MHAPQDLVLRGWSEGRVYTGQAMIRFRLVCLMLLPAAAGAQPSPEPVEGDYVLRDFRFASGESLDEVRIHYITMPRPGLCRMLVPAPPFMGI